MLHFASPASPPEYLAIPLESLDVSSLGTRRALDLALANDARFLLASTSEIYGDPDVHPQTEAYNGNVDPDGAPRRVRRGEAVRARRSPSTYRRLYDLPTAIVRIFNTYGPRLRPADGRVVSNFLMQAIDGKPLDDVRHRETRPARSATSPTRCAGSSRCSTPTSCDPVNIGNPDEITMLELVEIVREVTGSSSEIVFEPLPVGDPTRRRPDITRAKSCSAGNRRSSCATVCRTMHDWYLEERRHGRA